MLDRYSKSVLTVIAVCLVVLVADRAVARFGFRYHPEFVYVMGGRNLSVDVDSGSLDSIGSVHEIDTTVNVNVSGGRLD